MKYLDILFYSFLRKSWKKRIYTFLCWIIYPPNIFQTYRISRMHKRKRFIANITHCAKDIEYGHKVLFFSKEEKQKMNNRIHFARHARSYWFIEEYPKQYTFDRTVLKSIFESEEEMEVFVRLDKKGKLRRIMMNGNGRLYAIKQADPEAKITCRTYR